VCASVSLLHKYGWPGSATMCPPLDTLPALRGMQGYLLTTTTNLQGFPSTLAVRIGRTLQSFPPSKRSGRLSTHSAFQLGRTTLVEQISLDDCKVHQQFTCCHLRSLLHLLTIILFSFSWRTFTLSRPLQPGIWLLRRLRPPARTLAFSRPRQRSNGNGVPQFPHRS
jgi:hypothetical protein